MSEGHAKVGEPPAEPRWRSVRANGVDFSYLEDGPPDGPLALCLHGFPDSARGFRHLLPHLADAGYHAVAPWMRGYAPSGLPDDGCFQSGALATDACALHEALAADGDAVLIGHDWGAFASYGAAVLEPQRWRRVVAMAAPPLGALGEGFFSYDQLKRSFYVFFFQSPLAEMALSMNGYEFVDKLWADWSPGYDSSQDAANAKEALATPENLSAAVGYYRSMLATDTHDPRYEAAQQAASAVPSQPMLYLHGARDGCISTSALGDVESVLSEGSRFVVVEGAGHFLHVERPAEVNAEVLGFLEP